ncbi:MAG: hypothetical protein HY329_10240, partial [Chloroflexi bacterium]|nr:hypothetical protein [Chloroflexota bacterium]
AASPAAAPTVAPPPAAVTPAQSSAPNTGSAATSATPRPTQGGDLRATRAEKDVVRTFVDAQGRQIKLLYGRGRGRKGDYGWAHILGKHVDGVWHDGGTATTFPQAVGAKTPEAALGLLEKSVHDPKPDDLGGGRRGYVYAVANTNRDVFTVVGNDGTIITSYPVRHGSKDEDS